ncbi:MAG TPA: AAA family ATPase [Candidatus Limnocylindrales bacterium]
MRITRLHATDFRRYRELDVEFAAGLTVIRGPNEAGKTTIQRAIELALTRRVTSASADLEAYRPWDADPDARPTIRLEFEQEDDDGLQTGVLEKAFRAAKGTVRLHYDGQAISDPTLADQIMAELTGIPTEAFFRSTASVRHHEVADLARDEGALRDRLQASISGGDRGTSRARKRLEKALFDLNTKGDKNPGKLKVAEIAVAQEAAAVDQGEQALAQLERDRDTLAGARIRRTDTEAILAEHRSMLEKARTSERLRAERDTAQERAARLDEAVKVRDHIAHLKQTYPARDPLPALRVAVERLRAVEGRIRELMAALADEVDIHYELGTPEPGSWRPAAIASFIAILIGLLVAVPSAIGYLAGRTSLIVGLALVGVGAILAYLSIRQHLRAIAHSNARQFREHEINRRLRGRSQIQVELRQADADRVAGLAALELPDVAAAEDLLARQTEHVDEIVRLTARLDGLAGGIPPETLADLRDKSSLEIEQKNHALEALGPIASEPRARERLEVDVHDAEAAFERARDDESMARARAETNGVDAEAIAGHAERLATWRDQLAGLQRRARVYELALRAIEQAEQATMRTVTSYLEKHMVADLSRITDGRYQRVRVDDKTLDIAVFAPELGDWIDVRALSQGTVDLVFLAARIGLVRLITGDRRPPLIFDDPFVTLDDDRAARALTILREISKDFQVIYLTCSNRYDGAADSVRELDGPTVVDRGEPATVA